MPPLKAGAAQADITPPVGVKMAGYIRRQGVATGIHDRLWARTLYLSDGQTEVAFVSIDSLAVDQKLVQMVRERVEQTTGLPGKQVSLAATHTHSGPSGLAVLSFGGGYDADLLEFTVSQITQAVQQARAGAFEASLKVGSTVVEGVSQNRRDPAQPVDQQLHVLRIEDKQGRLRAVWANYPCHPTFLGFDNRLISADWPGAACSIVEKVVGDEVIVMMTNGASGNIHPMYLHQSLADLERVGQVLGGAIITVLGQLWPLGSRLRAHNIRWGLEFETEPRYGRQVVQSEVRLLHRRVNLPLKPFRSQEAYDSEIKDLCDQLRVLGLDEQTLTLMVENPGTTHPNIAAVDRAHYDLLARLNTLVGERLHRDHALSDAQGSQQQEIDLYLLRVDADLAVLLFPGELSSRIGLSIKQRNGVKGSHYCDIRQ